MPIPCFASTCTVDLSTGVNGELVANANIAETAEYPGGVTQPIGINTVNDYDEQQPGATRDDTITVTNPFACDAWVRFQTEFKIHGERRNDLPASGTDRGAVFDEVHYCTAHGDLTVAAPATQVKGESSRRVDLSGIWVPPAYAPGPDSDFGGFGAPNLSYGVNQWGWHQELIFLLPPSAAAIVTASITVIQKWHFDMVTGQTTAGRSGNQGVTIRKSTAIFLPDA